MFHLVPLILVYHYIDVSFQIVFLYNVAQILFSQFGSLMKYFPILPEFLVSPLGLEGALDII